jgi:hypothetical protein
MREIRTFSSINPTPSPPIACYYSVLILERIRESIRKQRHSWMPYYCADGTVMRLVVRGGDLTMWSGPNMATYHDLSPIAAGQPGVGISSSDTIGNVKHSLNRPTCSTTDRHCPQEGRSPGDSGPSTTLRLRLSPRLEHLLGFVAHQAGRQRIAGFSYRYGLFVGLPTGWSDRSRPSGRILGDHIRGVSRPSLPAPIVSV